MKYFNFVAAILLTILYAIGKIPPSEKYNLWLTTFIIPVALASNIILMLISLLWRKKTSIYYVVALVIGSNYLLSTVGLKYIFKKEKETTSNFSVLNYNTNALGDYDSATRHMRNWILSQEAEIQCYQEFVNYSASNHFDSVAMFHKKGYYTYFSYDSIHSYKSECLGILIASKFPIVKSGDIISSENGFNRIAYADVKIDGDTLRIINVHLESMGLKKYNPRYYSGFKSRKEHTKIILNKLKEGVFERSKQVKTLTAFIKTSPYPVICVGDFNEMPYSYSYQYLKKKMKNAFEEVGKGFGFTYHSQTLRMLRIDNQFYSAQLDVTKFETLNRVGYTDHFPLLGSYTIRQTYENSVTKK